MFTSRRRRSMFVVGHVPSVPDETLSSIEGPTMIGGAPDEKST